MFYHFSLLYEQKYTDLLILVVDGETPVGARLPIVISSRKLQILTID